MTGKNQMRVGDTEPVPGSKNNSVKEARADEVVEKGFSSAFIIGAVMALFVILGFPFFLMGKWIYKGIIALGFTEINSLYASLVICTVYILSILVFSIISRKSKTIEKRKKAKIYVRITAVIIPTLSVAAHLWRYFHEYSTEKQIPMNPWNTVFTYVIPIALGFVFWKITSRFLLKRSLKK